MEETPPFYVHVHSPARDSGEEPRHMDVTSFLRCPRCGSTDVEGGMIAGRYLLVCTSALVLASHRTCDWSGEPGEALVRLRDLPFGYSTTPRDS